MTVLDKDLMVDDIIGACIISLDSVFKNGKIRGTYNLLYKNRIAGQIIIDLEFYSK